MRVPLRFLAIAGMAFCISMTLAEAFAGDKTPADPLHKKLQGRWGRIHVVQTGKDTFRRGWLDLSFDGETLEIALVDGRRQKIESRNFIAYRIAKEPNPKRLHLLIDNRVVSEIYFDFVDDKLILIGRIVPRPFEGFVLSGEYRRVNRPK